MMLLVILLILSATVANMSAFIAQIAAQPSNTVYLGTIHYWEDYFFLLNHFFQGAHGQWLAVNQLTHDIPGTTIIYWSNVLMGKIGGLFGLSPQFTYSLSVLILTFLSLGALFILIQKLVPEKKKALLAFFFAVTATSLPNRVVSGETGQMITWPFQIWGTTHLALDRLGGAPHHLFRNVLAYIFLYFLFSKKSTMSIIVAFFLASVNPTQALLSLGIFSIVNWQDIKRLLPTWVSVVFMTLWVNHDLHSEAYRVAAAWDGSQNSYTTLPFLMASIGPIGLISLIGLMKKNFSRIELFGLLTILSTYFYFMTPIPKLLHVSNLRLLFPSTHVFFGIFAASGALYLSKKIPLVLILILYSLLTIPTLDWEIGMKTSNIKPNDQLLYLPSLVHEGFVYLSTQTPFTDVTLGNPGSHMDILIPALSGHTTYVAHFLETKDYPRKKAETEKFYSLQLTPDKAQKWLTENTIRYILFTKYDGDKTKFEENYSFLKPAFSNPESTVYQF